jgi:hypothetical protein
MDFLELFNAVARKVRPAYQDYKDVTDLDTPFPETGLDSMDGLMMGIFMCEIYGIDDETGKTMQPKTPREMMEFLEQHKTKTPASAKEAVDGVEW